LRKHGLPTKVLSGFAQSVVKSGFLLNGGGMVAIPAIVALFKLDASKGLWMLAAMGSAFVAGLLAAWAASICAFFALANSSGASYSEAIRANNALNALFTPMLQAEFTRQSNEAAAKAQVLVGKFRKFRLAASFLALRLKRLPISSH
jgi:hypothetical protein